MAQASLPTADSSFAPTESEELPTSTLSDEVFISSPSGTGGQPEKPRGDFVDIALPFTPALEGMEPEAVYSMKYFQHTPTKDGSLYVDLRNIVLKGVPFYYRSYLAYRIVDLKLNLQFVNNALDQEGILWLIGVRDPARIGLPAPSDFMTGSGANVRYLDKIGVRIGNNTVVELDQISKSWFFTLQNLHPPKNAPSDIRNCSPGGVGFIYVGGAADFHVELTWTGTIEFAYKTKLIPEVPTFTTRTIPLTITSNLKASLEVGSDSALLTLSQELTGGYPFFADIDTGVISYFRNFNIKLAITDGSSTLNYQLPVSGCQYAKTSTDKWDYVYDFSPVLELNLTPATYVCTTDIIEFPFGEIRFIDKTP